MTATSDRSPQDWATLVAQKDEKIAALTAQVAWYESQLRRAAQQRYRGSAFHRLA